MTKIKTYKFIKHLLTIVVIAFLMSSCRVAKKEWVQENYASKTEVNEFLTTQTESQKKELKEISETFNAKFSQLSQQQSESATENENTNVTGTITAEEGKSKSVTIGNTTIKSEGANVSFQVNKSISKEFEQKYSKLESNYESQSHKLSLAIIDINALKHQISELQSNKNIEKNTRQKTIKKTGFPFGVWIIFALVLIVLAVLWYFKKSIAFLNKTT